MASPSSIARARLRGEAGFGLIEVMVSALLLVISSLAVLGALDSASEASGRSKNKAVAANLAEQDQERLRGKPASELIAFYEKKPQVVDDVTFDVESVGSYQVNPVTTAGCTGNRNDERLGIVSTVTQRTGSRAGKPVRIESLIAPPLDAASPGKGSALVRVLRGDGLTGVPDIDVNLSGPENWTQKTGPQGCANYSSVAIGAYAGRFSKPGFVDPSGANVVNFNTTVTTTELASSDFLYDQPGSVSAAIWTRVGTAYTADDSHAITLAHGGILTGGGQRIVAATPSPAASFSASALFPFGSPYDLYSGSCAANSLTGAPTPMAASELAQLPSTYVRAPTITSGVTQSVRVFEPAFNVRVTLGGVAYGGATVNFYQRDGAGCNRPRESRVTQATTGRILRPGFPYGNYDICAEAPAYPGQRIQVFNQRNNLAAGRDINLTDSMATSGACPAS